MILERAADCGISFGASRRYVRSERMKNTLLEVIPELQWAGINTFGCKAVISVRERPEEEKVDKPVGVSSIVASMDGVVTECTVTKGSIQCNPGDAVKRGQLLISGYTDCGLKILATCAEGEVTALTKRELSVISPSKYSVRTERLESKQYYSLVFGKKRINLYKCSGICGGSCVKMYSKYVLTLPGGFELPVSVIRETVTPALTELQQIAERNELLCGYADSYLSGLMTDGRILQKDVKLWETDSLFCLAGKYACLESIVQRQEEKIGDQNG
jgi:sporulation protein YqfD